MDSSFPALDPVRDQLLAEVNRARQSGFQCGEVACPPVPPLSRHVLLDQAAQAHSEAMAGQGFFSHVDLAGRSSFDRIRAAGYAFRAAGENIASGNALAVPTLKQLLDSVGHCQVIMSALYLHVGIGHARSLHGEHYWTLDFASPA